jgi:hypothetical protein
MSKPKKIEKVMAILVPRWLDFSCQAWLQICPNITMVNSVFVWAVYRNPLVASYVIVRMGKMDFLIQI